jgi:hypothetical protein
MSLLPQDHPGPADDGFSAINSATSADLGCCSLAKLSKPLMLTLAILAMSLGAYFAGRNAGQLEQIQSPEWTFPPINATASATSEKFSIATGSVSDDAEGLYVLDHNSGLVQCSVIYPRSGQFLAKFSANVADALGTGGKGGKYIMVTGHADFPRASNRPVGSTILYVLDTATGNYACYGVPFDRGAQHANHPQQGALVLIYQGTANPLIDRDSFR